MPPRERGVLFLVVWKSQYLSGNRKTLKTVWHAASRALNSTGQTIDFLLTAKRDAAAAKRFLRKAIDPLGSPMPRVMNVDQKPGISGCGESAESRWQSPRPGRGTALQV